MIPVRSDPEFLKIVWSEPRASFERFGFVLWIPACGSVMGGPKPASGGPKPAGLGSYGGGGFSFIISENDEFKIFLLITPDFETFPSVSIFSLIGKFDIFSRKVQWRCFWLNG